MKRVSFFSYLFVAFCTILTIVGVSFAIIYSESEVRRVVAEVSKTQATVLELFSDSVKKDLKFGNYPEIYRKCSLLMQKSFVDSVVVLDMNGKSICSSEKIDHESLEQLIYFDNKKKEIAGVVKFEFKPLDIDSLSSIVFSRILKVIIVILIISFLLVFFFIQFALKGLRNTSDFIAHLDFDNYSTNPMKPSSFKEVYQLQVSIEKMLKQLKELKNKQFDLEVQKTTWQISRQIAHDIRSPLEALRSVTGHIDELDFQHRKIITSSIQRISDIANGLLREGRGVDKVGLVNLNILVEEVYQDKIFEQGNNIKLVSNITYNDSFVYGDENALYRVLSNIINNSFEAYKSNKGEVLIEVDVSNSFVEIKVQDFGEGMSSEFVQKIIEGGVTTKDKGNGLGVSSAKNEISKHNGKFTIDSKIGVGTIIKIELPRVVCPSWFSSIIEVDLSLEKIICVDDDPAFLEFYQEKLKEFKDKTVCISAKNFEDHTISKYNQYFFDYDLGNDKTGLDLILDNNISQQSTLVTSMYQDEKIQDICTKNGIKILPKQIFNTAKVKSKSEAKSKIIFIDNDDLMHLAWKMEASKKDISIKTYFSVDEFLDDADKFSNEIKIYIDSDLGDGIRGEVESKKIFDHGFTNLYLATGYLAEDISKPDWIIDIVGKRPTFLT